MEENIDNSDEVLEVKDTSTETSSENEVTNEIVTEENKSIEEQVKAPTEEEIQARIDTTVEKRLKRERRDMERKNKSLYQIEETLKKGLGVEGRDEILSKLQDFYKVTPTETTNPKDEEFLGKAYGQEIVENGDIQEIEDEANRLASIPRDKRTVRENAMFNVLCQKLISNKQENELKEKGIDTKILLDKDFNNFRSKLNSNVSIIEAVDMYNKLNLIKEPVKEKPASPGSAKTKGTVTDDTIKEFYTFDEAKNFTKEDYKRKPKLFEAVKKSMPKW